MYILSITVRHHFNDIQVYPIDAKLIVPPATEKLGAEYKLYCFNVIMQ